MLRIDLRRLGEGVVEVTGALPPDDPIFRGSDLDLAEPVQVSGLVQAAGSSRYYWRGRIEARVVSECRRCLREVTAPVDQRVDIVFDEDPTSDDPSVYPVPEAAQILDLSEAVREELLLAVPRYVLCKNECLGLCARCGADLNERACSCSEALDPRWAALRELKAKIGNEETNGGTQAKNV